MRIDLWWKFEGRYYWKDFVTGLRNLYSWFPVIWRNRDYDHSYIYTILVEKLKRQAKYIEDKKYHVGYDKDVRNMRTCISLIEKINSDFYSCEYLDYCESNFNFIPLPGKEGYSELEIEEVSEHFDDYFKKYPLIYGRVRNGEIIYSGSDKKTIAMNMANINENRARKLLFKILENNISSWWT